jgi:hypothetical protein
MLDRMQLSAAWFSGDSGVMQEANRPITGYSQQANYRALQTRFAEMELGTVDVPDYGHCLFDVLARMEAVAVIGQNTQQANTQQA